VGGACAPAPKPTSTPGAYSADVCHTAPAIFIAWCTERRSISAVAIPTPPVSTHREVFTGEDTRWRIARHLLHDDTNTTADRVAGLLVLLLYGQPVARIVHLSTDNITHTGTCLGRRSQPPTSATSDPHVINTDQRDPLV
jgi:hypothetical protein